MTERGFSITRRGLLAGLGGAGVGARLGLAAPALAAAPGRTAVILQARPATPDMPIASLRRTGSDPLRFVRGDELAVRFENQLTQPAVLNWHGIDGAPATEPLTSRQPVAAGGSDEFVLLLRQGGSFLCDIRLLADGQGGPMPAQALVVQENEPVAVDRDEVLLIEDRRLGSDGRAVAPGAEPKDAATSYTVNGVTAPDISLRTNARFRLRIINGCQRNIIAVKIEDHDVLVIALDGQPAEPFLARNGLLVLAPGTRIDAFVDGTRAAGSIAPITLHDGGEARPLARLVYSDETPIRAAPLPAAAALPGNGLPSQLDLKGALRVDLTLGASPASPPDWTKPAGFTPNSAPAFQVKRGRTVVLALTNRAAGPAVFHLHGHHFRLLDRLDDGWKPFWLDTLAIDAGQTQRVAFAAEFAGLWLMEAMVAEWSSPRLLRSYAVV